MTVRLSEAPGRPLVIPLKSMGATGASDDDYSGVPSAVAFASTDTATTFDVTAFNDTDDDDGETVELAFGELLPSGVTLGSPDAATVTLADNNESMGPGPKDTTAPTVSSITSGATHPTKDAFTVTISFSEEVTGLTAGGIAVSNGRGSNFAGTGASYTLDIEPNANIEGDVTVRVPADAAVDGANLGNIEGSETFAVDTRAPVLQSATVVGAALTLTYGESLDRSSTPTTGDFTVNVESAGRTVSNVAIGGSTVTLTLDPAVEHGDTGITVSYRLGTNPIQDAVGNDAGVLTDQEVTNITPPPAVTTCSGGMAGPYSCSNVDLMSFLALDDIGGGGGNDIWGWTDSSTGKEYAIMGRTNGTSFVDISDPVSPIYLGNLPPHSDDSSHRDIKVYANHAFIVTEADNSGMQVFDLTQLRAVASPPATFSETAHYAGFSDAHNLAINEDSGFAYAVGTNNCSAGLHMINIQNPTNPTTAGCFSADGYTHDAQCVNYDGPDLDHRGKEICFNSNVNTLTIVDVTSKAVPVQLSRTGYIGSEFTHQGWLTEDHDYFLLGDELDEITNPDVTKTRTYLWNLSNLDAPALIGVHDSTTTATDHNLYVKGNYTYQSNYVAGLRILDITDIAHGNLSEVAFFDVVPSSDAPGSDTGTWSNYPFFASGIVVVSTIDGGLFILRPNLVDTINPVLRSAAVVGDALTLTYGEALDGSSTPATGDFTVNVESAGRTVSNVAIGGSTVTLTLDPAVEHGDTGITVSYRVPGTNPIRDAVGNDAGVLTNQGVTNITPPPDRAALVALYNATGGANWTFNTNWLGDEPLSEWRGVTTNDDGRVTELDLRNNQLTGEIPAELSQLAQLESLALGSNQLTGEIPVELSQLPQLETLNLSSNQLKGEIPVELAQLGQLQSLSLSDNPLKGEIPVELSQLSQLEGLDLSRNQLTGEIPVELSQLPQLTYLDLSDNPLKGEIPAELSELSQLRHLYLRNNQLTGEIPEELSQLPQLETLDLSDNPLTGEIPVELAQLPQLRHLDLSSNQLTGEIPVELGNLGSLQELYLNDNQLTGEIPSWLVRLTQLRELALWGNQLTGTIPPEVAPAQDRAVLRLFYNATGGATWADNTAWLSNAPLSAWHGVITDANGRVTSLSLSANGLTGTIPPELENLDQLQVFDIRNTGLCVTAGSELHTWLATINFQGSVCGSGGGGGGGGFSGGGGGGPTTSAPGAPRNLTAVGGDGEVVLSWDAPESNGGFAITDYEYRINGRNPWISIGSTLTTHTVNGLVNGTEYTFRVRAVNAVGASAPSNLVEVTPGVGALEFAHFANGSSITSDLVLVNVAPHPIRLALYFYDRGGNRIAAESVLEVTGELEVTEDGSLTVQRELEPLQELTISTHGQGEVVAGSVTVLSNGPIGGVLRFDLPGVGVAGVGASQPVRDALFPARRQAEGISTAAAIRNLEEEELVVSCRLMQEGAVLEEVDIELEAKGQDGRFIQEVFTATDTSDFVGLVRCTAEGEFAGVAVELDAGNGIFTTLPVLAVERTSARVGEYKLEFAHFANGSSITSDLVLVNVSTQRSRPAPTPFHTDIPPTRPSFYFYDRGGDRIAAESVVEITGDDLDVTEDGALTVQRELEPLQELTISTHGQGEVVAGSVTVVAEGPLGGVLRFDLPGVGVAGVGTGQPVKDALFPARRQAGGISTAAAIRNLEEEELVVSCQLMQEGAVLEEVDIELQAKGQDGRFIEEVFTRTDTSDFVGLVRCTAEGEFAGVAVELDAGTGIFTTLPVVPVEERMDRE